MYHPERVSEWAKTGDCAPIYLEVGPTNRCNHRCIFCALDWLQRGGSDLSKEVLLPNLENMAQSGVKSLMFAGEGEPLLNKNTPKFIEYAHQKGIDVSMTTNGVFFTPQVADKSMPSLSWVRFSVDAGTSEVYSKLHGTRESDFYKVIANIKYAAEIKRKNKLNTSIDVQFLLLPENDKISNGTHEALKLAELVKDAGAKDLQIKPYSHHPLSKNTAEIKYQEHFSLEKELEKLNSDSFKIIFRKNTMERLENEVDYKNCLGLPFFALIDSNGNVIPCNMFYNNPEFTYGNINEQLFSQIWASDKRKEVVKRLAERGTSECRRGCRLDVINRYLERVKRGEIKLEDPLGTRPPHVNFI